MNNRVPSQYQTEKKSENRIQLKPTPLQSVTDFFLKVQKDNLVSPDFNIDKINLNASDEMKNISDQIIEKSDNNEKPLKISSHNNESKEFVNLNQNFISDKNFSSNANINNTVNINYEVNKNMITNLKTDEHMIDKLTDRSRNINENTKNYNVEENHSSTLKCDSNKLFSSAPNLYNSNEHLINSNLNTIVDSNFNFGLNMNNNSLIPYSINQNQYSNNNSRFNNILNLRSQNIQHIPYGRNPMIPTFVPLLCGGHQANLYIPQQSCTQGRMIGTNFNPNFSYLCPSYPNPQRDYYDNFMTNNSVPQNRLFCQYFMYPINNLNQNTWNARDAANFSNNFNQFQFNKNLLNEPHINQNTYSIDTNNKMVLAIDNTLKSEDYVSPRRSYQDTDARVNFRESENFNQVELYNKKSTKNDSDFIQEKQLEQNDKRIKQKRDNQNTSKIPRKQCISCQAEETSLWRDLGTESKLCNACGIRYSKYKLMCNECRYVPGRYESLKSECRHCEKGTFKMRNFSVQ